MCRKGCFLMCGHSSVRARPPLGCHVTLVCGYIHLPSEAARSPGARSAATRPRHGHVVAARHPATPHLDQWSSIHPSHGRSATHCRSLGRHWHEPVRPPLRGAYRAAFGSSVCWAAHLCERCYCDSSFPSRISASCARGQLCVHRACLFLVRCLRTLISFTCCRITYWGITCCRLKCGRLAVSSRAVSSCAVASCRVLLHAIGCCTVASCAVAMHLFYRLGFLVARHAPHFLVAGNAILFHKTLMSQLILVNQYLVGYCHLQGGMVCDDAQPLCV